MTFEEFLEAQPYKDNIFHSFTLLLESFNSPVEVKYFPPKDVEGSIFWVGEFSVNDKDFNIIFEVPEDTNALGVNFSQIVKGKVTHEDLNNLNKQEVLGVFSTVISETDKIIKANNYNSIHFQANTSKKFKVYDKILTKYIQGYGKVTDENSIMLIIHKDYNVDNIKNTDKIKLKFKKIKL